MAKTQEQKIKEIEYKAQQELKKRLREKDVSLTRKYDAMIETYRGKLKMKQNLEYSRAEKKIKRQVDTKLKNKIRKIKWHKEVNYKKKQESVAKIKNRLLTTLQKYSRLRDARSNGNCECISCWAIRHRTKCDGWHMYSRAINSVAFDLTNINAQCKKCNWFMNGNFEWYRAWYIDKYGQEAFDELTARKYKLEPLNREWMLDQLEYYTKEVARLEENMK